MEGGGEGVDVVGVTAHCAEDVEDFGIVVVVCFFLNVHEIWLDVVTVITVIIDVVHKHAIIWSRLLE